MYCKSHTSYFKIKLLSVRQCVCGLSTLPNLTFYRLFVRIFDWFAFSLIAKSAFRYHTIHFLLIDLDSSLNCFLLKALLDPQLLSNKGC